MIRSIPSILAICILFAACGQSHSSNRVTGITIDPAIKREVEKHIEDSKEFDAFHNKMEVFANALCIESFENDSLIFQSTDFSQKQGFHSFYLWKGDTLTIDGSFGLFGGIGFGIDIYKNNATLYHMLSADDFPQYAYNETDSLVFRLEVPCTNTKIALSEIPDSTKSPVIYGYVEFKSASYFAESGQQNGHEASSRKKLRNNMKIYFRSRKLNYGL